MKPPYASPPLDDAGTLEASTLVHFFEARAAAAPAELFARFGQRPALALGDLAELVRRFARRLGERGVGHGDRVLVALESSPEFLVAWLGLGYAGAVLVPLVPRSGLRAFERALELTEPALAVVNESAATKLRSFAAERLPEIVEVGDDGTEPLCPDFERTLLAPSGDGEPNRARGQELAAILFTSGTTGLPKGVCLAHLWYVWASLDVAGALRYGPADTLYTCLPLGHANAQDTTFGPALLSGASVVFDQQFSASGFWARLAETGATAFNLIGNMPEILLNRPADELTQHGAWRAFAVPALPHQYEPFQARFGVRLVEGYGSTEIGVPVFQGLDASRPGACGRPLEGSLIRVLREDGLPAATGERGEISAWSPRPGGITSGYWRDEGATARAWSGGWFRTGDLGYFDEDGYLHFGGRLSESLRRKGENISAFELETVLLELPEIAECAVVGRRRGDGDDDIVVFVIAAPGARIEHDRLGPHCAQALGRHAVPSEIVEADVLPRTESGKIAKATLAQQVRSQEPLAS